jgi:hypothetical protein
MLVLKSCPRCGGDLILETLPDGTELFCLQCAHRVAPGSVAAGWRRLAEVQEAVPSKSLRIPATTST